MGKYLEAPKGQSVVKSRAQYCSLSF